VFVDAIALVEAHAGSAGGILAVIRTLAARPGWRSNDPRARPLQLEKRQTEDRMPTSKRFTNVYFTKRVDHDGGRHHTPRAPAEPLLCEQCGAVYVRRRWVAPADPAKREIPVSAKTKTIRCPTCRQRHDGLPCGFVKASGPFLLAHRDEIERLLTNEAARVVDDNPTARIMTWNRATAGALELTTTTPHLAQRLGHALEKAFGGTVVYDFSHENRVARVSWCRE
jgi:hypothetical protein